MVKKVIIVFFVLVTQLGICQDAHFRVEHFTGQNGLSMNGLLRLSQDEKGFIWFRTDEGIVKYDGYAFSAYTQNPIDPHALFQKVDDIYDDQRGHIWINYNGLGLSYLNKSLDRFENFKPGHDDISYIGNHDIQTYYTDQKDLLWIGTDYGLYSFDYTNKSFRYYDFPFALSVTSLFTDNIGNLWIGTDSSEDDDGVGLYLLERSTEQLHQIKGKYTGIVNDIFQDSKGRIWSATMHGVGKVMNYSPGVTAFTETYLDIYTYETGSKQDRNRNEITRILESTEGQLWFSTNMGIARMVEGESRFSLKYYLDDESQKSKLGRNSIETVLEAEGTIWVLSRTVHQGLCTYNEEKDTFETNLIARSNFRMSKFQLINMYVDRNSVMWIGTVREGLLKIDLEQKKFSTFRHDELDPASLPSNKVYEITEQSNGNLWIGTSGGVSKYNPGKPGFQHFNTTNTDINDDMVFSTLIDSKDNLWLGHWPTQVSKINLNTWKNTPFKYIIGSDTTGFFVWTSSAIEEDAVGDIWFGSHGAGLWKSIGGERVFKNYLFESNDSENSLAIDVLFFDADGKLWIGTSFGLYTFNINLEQLEFVMAYEGNRLFQEGIYCITEVGSNLWIGTYAGGLVKLDKSNLTIERFVKEDGLSGNTVRGILSENDRHLWISTTTGLSQFDIETKQFKNYTKEDGIQGNEFNVNSYFKSSDNTFYFGGTEGLTMFRPEEIKDNPYPAMPRITNLHLFNEQVTVGDTINGQIVLPKIIDEVDQLVLNHKNKIISIEFASMHMTSPTKNQYKYMLEGLEEDWNIVNAGRRLATYTSLPAGDYIFRLRATNNDGIWSDNEATLNIEVLPPWWNSLPFRVFFLMVLLSLVLLLFRIRIMSIRLRNKKLQAMVEEKTVSLKAQNKEIQLMSDKLQEAAQSKIGFFMNVSHEFRTPLALILGPAANLIASSHLSDLDRENVNLIERNGHRLLRLTNQLLDSANLERGSLKLKVAQGDVVDYVLQIVHAFDFRAETISANYQFSTNEAKFTCWFDGDKLEKILYNLISNAFKFTEYPAKISIDLKVNSSTLIIMVTDNGLGLTKEEVNKIFDRFYQVDNKNRRKTGTGIGLNLAKLLAQKHKGDLTVESNQGEGSRFSLKIPVNEDDFSEEEHIQYQPDLRERIEQIHKLTQKEADNDQPKKRGEEELPTLLHVEDSLDMRSYMKANLQAHYTVFQAKDGVEGLKKAEELLPDMIISDVMMPLMDGIEFCEKIKGNDYLSHIPVILLTAKTGGESQIEGYGVGADEYLTKPIDLNLLKARIDNLLTSRKKLRDSFSSNIDLIPKELLQNRSDEVFLEKAVKIVQQNLSDPELSYHAFVKTLGVGKTQLYNRINKISGQSINIFIRTIRLKIAAKLIHEGSMTFSEISYEVGFSDPNYFSKCFKKQYGMSPKAFQEQGAE